MFNISINGNSFSENLDEFDSIRSVLLYRLVKSRHDAVTTFQLCIIISVCVLQTQHVVRGWTDSEYQSGFENLQEGKNEAPNEQSCVNL